MISFSLRQISRVVPVALLALWTSACNDLSGLAGTQSLPSGTPDPSAYHTAAGALALYQEALAAFQYSTGVTTTNVGATSTSTTNGAFVDDMLQSGLLTDELQTGLLGAPSSSSIVTSNVDARLLPEGETNNTDAVYNELQAVRNDAAEGIAALTTYDDSAPSSLRGQLYALQGYTEVLLADLYCSGVPLSTLNFTGGITYASGSTTTQLYQAAIAQFDTALVLSTDSARIANLAWVGKGRAFLDLGQFDSAAVAAANVSNGFSYQFLVNWGVSPAYTNSTVNVFTGASVSVADQEGTNGLPYRSSGDPRTASKVIGLNSYGAPIYGPVKYGGATPGIFPITVADWIEARLIQAEAAYHGVATGQGSWLDQLNALRQTAITPALPPLTDPGTDSGRVALLFQERAYWLFLTGHRQGDLRRLIRQYGRASVQVYPIGAYPGGNPSLYGSAVTAPVPPTESVNPLFTGCLSQGA